MESAAIENLREVSEKVECLLREFSIFAELCEGFDDLDPGKSTCVSL